MAGSAAASAFSFGWCVMAYSGSGVAFTQARGAGLVVASRWCSTSMAPVAAAGKSLVHPTRGSTVFGAPLAGAPGRAVAERPGARRAALHPPPAADRDQFGE